MALRTYANAPATTLAAACTNVQTTITVAATTGFPITYPFILILDRGTASEEVVLCTAASGTVLTVTRGYDSTTAFSHSLGAGVVHGVAAIDHREANAHVNANSGVHGVTGSVVGTTDTQTLTNKTLTSPVIPTVGGSSHDIQAGSFTWQGFVVACTTAIQTLTNKTIGATNAINGFTASRFMESDSTGRLVSGSKTIPTGDVVGTSDAQTLSNKTFTSPQITGTTSSSGSLELGAVGSANTPFVDFHSSASATDFDARIIASGGTASNGQGDLNVSASTFRFNTNTIATITTMGAWTAWTPTLSNWTLGNGALVGRYVQIGKTVHFTITFIAGSTTVFSGAPLFTFPVAPRNVTFLPVGWAGLNNSGILSGVATAYITSDGTTMALMVGTSAVTATSPFTFGNGDAIHIVGTYEAA